MDEIGGEGTAEVRRNADDVAKAAVGLVHALVHKSGGQFPLEGEMVVTSFDTLVSYRLLVFIEELPAAKSGKRRRKK